MISRLLITILFFTLLLTGCTRFTPHQTSNHMIRPVSQNYHIVQKGDTLYSIAWQSGSDYRKVAAWNNIRWPYRIHPGQRISLKAKITARETKPTRKTKKTYSKKAPAKYKKKVLASKSGDTVKWSWPTRGKIIGYFSSKEPGKKGVDIAGRVGQSIKAAASGRVVYSGNGLRGYGNLIIIKHNETYFSAYAHNRNNFVKENQKVKLGQKIADMGDTGANKVMLHFEIRRNGRPINPLRYLPKT